MNVNAAQHSVSGRLGLCAFFELFLELRKFSVSGPFSPQPPVSRQRAPGLTQAVGWHLAQ